jgi:hypothetical protein
MAIKAASSVDDLNPVERKLVVDALQLQIASYTRAARAAKTNEINAAYGKLIDELNALQSKFR